MATLSGINISTEIVALIAAHTLRADLFSLCRVCRSFQEHSQPLIYEHIECSWSSFSDQIRPIPLLLHTLTRRPTLTSYTRSLELKGWAPLTISIATQMGKPDGSYKLYEQQDSKDLIRKLLAAFTKLRSLKLNILFQDGSAFTLEGPVGSLPSAAFLEYTELLYFQDPKDFVGVLNLPSLQSFSTKLIESHSLRPLVTHSGEAEKLTKLALYRSHLTEKSLGHILSLTPNLRTFKYHYVCNIDATDSLPRSFDGPKVAEALYQVRRTLRSLVISVAFRTDEAIDIYTLDPDEYTVTGTLGLLAEFPRLDELTIPLVVLLGWTPNPKIRLSDILPSNLRNLNCTDDLVHWDCFVWTGVAALSYFLEYLMEKGVDEAFRILEFRAEGYSPLWTPDLLDGLQAVCEARNIECDLRS